MGYDPFWVAWHQRITLHACRIGERGIVSLRTATTCQPMVPRNCKRWAGSSHREQNLKTFMPAVLLEPLINLPFDVDSRFFFLLVRVFDDGIGGRIEVYHARQPRAKIVRHIESGWKSNGSHFRSCGGAAVCRWNSASSFACRSNFRFA